MSAFAAAGSGAFQRVQEVHGHVHHHSQPQGNLPPPGRHLAQVSSKVRLQLLITHEPE